jgi:hypothetical protein
MYIGQVLFRVVADAVEVFLRSAILTGWVRGFLEIEVSHDFIEWIDAGRITTQLGTPRGRYDEYNSKFSLSKKPRFISPGKSQTPEGDAD